MKRLVFALLVIGNGAWAMDNDEKHEEQILARVTRAAQLSVYLKVQKSRVALKMSDGVKDQKILNEGIYTLAARITKSGDKESAADETIVTMQEVDTVLKSLKYLRRSGYANESDLAKLEKFIMSNTPTLDDMLQDDSANQ